MIWVGRDGAEYVLLAPDEIRADQKRWWVSVSELVQLEAHNPDAGPSDKDSVDYYPFYDYLEDPIVFGLVLL